MMGGITVPVQNQHAFASHIDIRRIVPMSSHNQHSLSDLPPLVPGSSGQQCGNRDSFIDHEARGI